MFNGWYCQSLMRRAHNAPARIGNMSIEDYAAHMMADAASPEQLDALAAELLHMSQGIKTRGPDFAVHWKAAWREVTREAHEARARFGKFADKTARRNLMMSRTVGAPGKLYDEVRLPIRFQLHLPTDKMSVGVYSTPLRTDTVYRVAGMRDCAAWLEPEGQDQLPGYQRVSTKVDGAILKGLIALGRIEPLEIAAKLPLAA